MPLFGDLALLLALLLICAFFPGFFFVRRLHWTPLEKLCGSVGLSLALIYSAAWAIYCFGPGNQRPAFWLVAAAAAALGVLSSRDAWRLFASFRIRQTLLAFGCLLVWTFAMLSMIRVYSGASWSGDWYEHLQRSLFFLDRLPPGLRVLGNYVIPSRPPMQNVLAAFFLGLTSDRFELFQAIFAFLGVLLFLPCVLLLPALGVNKRRGLVPLLALFAASPVVMENLTYTWTKALAAFFVILGICLYLAGWRKDEKTRTAAAFLALAAGALVHFSAGPYIVVMGLHYLVRVFRGRRWRELVLVIAPAVLLLATWFGWSLKVYGAKATFQSNTSVTSSAPTASQNFGKIGGNIFDTVVPSWLRNATPAFDQPNAWGKLRDRAFAFYQLNLVFAMGAIGGPLILWLVYRSLIRGEARKERLFWRILVPGCVLLGIAVVGERDPGGVPHLTLLALEVAGLVFLAAAFPKLSRPLRLAVVLGCCLDFSLGVYLQARIESLENIPGQSVFPELSFVGPNLTSTDRTAESLTETAWFNWLIKRRTAINEKWLRELPPNLHSDPKFQALVSRVLEGGIQDDAANWGGWAARHGGVAQYLGDSVGGLSGGGTDIASGVFLLMFAGCFLLILRQAWRPAAEPHPLPHAVPVKRMPPQRAARHARR